MSSISRSSSLRSQFPSHSLVNVSRLDILNEAHCKHVEQFIGVTCTMAMKNGNQVNLARAWRPPPREHGELITVGQVPMATDHGDRRTMPTGGEGFLIGGRQSGTQKETMMETWTVHPLNGMLLGVGKASEGEQTGERLSNLTVAQSTTLSTVSCSTAQQCIGEGEPGSFAGSSLPPRTKSN